MEEETLRLVGALGRLGLGLGEPDSVQEAAGRVSTNQIGGLARREGLGAFFLWALEAAGARGHLAAPVLAELERVAAHERAHMVRVHLVAAQALEHLDRLGIPAVVVKGMATASFWPAPLLRTMQDVDVLVPEEFRERLWSDYGPLRELQATLGVTPEVEPCHHDLTLGDTVPIPFQDVFSRARPGTVAGVRTRVADPGHLLLFTAGNSLRKDPRALRGLLDAGFLIRSEGIEPGALAREAAALGLATPLRLLFRLARLRFGLLVPGPLFEGLASRRDRLVKRYLGLDKPGAERSPLLLQGGVGSRWVLRLLMEPAGRLLSRTARNLFPSAQALRNQNAKQGDQGRGLAFLYARHWWGFARRLRPGLGG